MSADRIPVLDLGPEIESLWPELNRALQSVLRSGLFILGPEVGAFEEEAARYLQVKHAVGVNSGTDALVLGLRALGLGEGDEVITTPFSFAAAAEAICLVGCRPVFADIDPRTFNLDPGRLEAAIGPRTRAIVPVHLFGQGADMTAIRELADRYGLLVLEDVAQAFGGRFAGRKLGRFGHAAAFSFFPTKNLGACGDGGLIATDDERVANEARMLRAHGARRKYFHETLGYNSRLDELQAAILRVKLPHVDRWNEERRQAAQRYDRLLAEIPALVTPLAAEACHHVYHQYTVRVTGGRRDRVRDAVAAAGIATMVYYPVPLHRLPIFAERADTLPVAERAAEEVLSLPIWPRIPLAVQERVADTLARSCE